MYKGRQDNRYRDTIWICGRKFFWYWELFRPYFLYYFPPRSRWARTFSFFSLPAAIPSTGSGSSCGLSRSVLWPVSASRRIKMSMSEGSATESCCVPKGECPYRFRDMVYPVKTIWILSLLELRDGLMLVLWLTILPMVAGSWDQPRGVVAKVEWHQEELFPRVGFIVTNMSAKPEGVVHFYNGRGTAEQWIKEGKYALNWTRRSHANGSSRIRCGSGYSFWPITRATFWDGWFFWKKSNTGHFAASSWN